MRTLRVPIGRAGALIDIEIGVSTARRNALVRQGREVPPAVKVPFLVDTGASSSMVDDSIMRTLQLTPTSAAQFHSASSNGLAQSCDVFDVSVLLGGTGRPTAMRFDPLPILATAFINHPSQGLLGRDVLNHLQLEWNGPGTLLTISYP